MIKIKFKNQKLKLNKGITLLMAVVIVSILLSISFAVVSIAVKSTIFAYSGRDSHYAFNAADAGIECALYWDSIPATSAFDPDFPGFVIDCGGYNMFTHDPIIGKNNTAITSDTLIGGGSFESPQTRTSVFGFKLDQGANPTNSCVIVTVTKNLDGSTYIKSRGYNTCDSSPRRIERGIEVTY
ncbi:MAG: hypothetical protein JW740_00215 [Candidatus Zambryskibacteria bacterium]|nr:hypothetical protein [Candidatus Zambryskibacteria bacterium]